MLEKQSEDLSNYRLDKAKKLLTQSETLFDTQAYDGSINRSYYAVFNAIRSLLALVKVDRPTHKGVISLFDRYFVKNQNF